MKKTLYNFKYFTSIIWKNEKAAFLCFSFNTISVVFLPIIQSLLPKITIELLLVNSTKTFLWVFLSCFALLFLNSLKTISKNKFHCQILRVRFYLYRKLSIITFNKKYNETEENDFFNQLDLARNSIFSHRNGFEFIYRKLFDAIGILIVCCTFIVIIFLFNPILLLLVIAVNILVFIIDKKNNQADYEANKNNTEDVRKASYIFDIVNDNAYAKEIRIYDLSSWLTKRYSYLIDILKNTGRSNENRHAKKDYLKFILTFAIDAVSYGYLIFLVINNKITIANFTYYLGAMATLNNSISQMLSITTDIIRENNGLNDYLSFVNKHGQYNLEERIKTELTNIKSIDTIEFKNVYFKYRNKDTYAIKNFNLYIKKNEKIALVGENGAGKSTLIYLLLRLYTPDSGEILVNGLNIKQYNLQEYYDLFSVAFQDVKIFPFSVLENITFSQKELVNIDLLKQSVREADIESKIQRLKDTFDAPMTKTIYENGIEFSGGENQKLILARMFYKNSSVFILDEPTSKLDPLAESNLYTNFYCKSQENISIFISHRLSSTKFCNRIIVMNEGEILEFGSHDELINNRNKYYDMFTAQAKAYEETRS